MSEGTTVAPFIVEADHHRNSDLLIQAIPGMRMRSAIDGSKSVRDPQTGESVGVPVDQVTALGGFPKTKGQQILVKPADLAYKVTDPLHDDEKALAHVARFMRKNGTLSGDGKLGGVPDQIGALDVDRMKTLCRELRRIVDSGDAKVIKGPLPKMEQIENMPGNFLVNPGSTVYNSQPQYEKDMPAFQQALNRITS